MSKGDLGTTIERSRPSDFMRARRPELYSDSRVLAENSLSRELLEYHLETLTNRKQETHFEYFCRRLAEKELCPNLLPQTGPTGGGDSKVDSETYPVAEAISERWYEGIGQEAAQQRWGFAFSAKKDWRTKVASDVEKIVSTNRDYKLITLSLQSIHSRQEARVCRRQAIKKIQDPGSNPRPELDPETRYSTMIESSSLYNH